MIRTRFAPSPTGDLHIGNIRTALYAWLFARHHQGVFILRIEDTDLARSTPESTQKILEALHWLELNVDEGPFFQTDRFPRYTEVANQLVQSGKAYKCYCSKERLETLRKQQSALKEKPRYDGHCRELHENKDAPYVIRLKTPLDGTVMFNDLIHGPITYQNNELDDLILIREDGTPTYNFTVVVDDIDMKITHVLRGDGHINNTPRQIHIYSALNAPIPEFGHLPSLLGEKGKKLSKREGAMGILEYRNKGYLPQALLNFIVRLGWAHKDQEIFSVKEMIELFDLANVHKAPAIINTEKLLWLNQHYIKTLDPDLVVKELLWHFEKAGLDSTRGPDLKALIQAQGDRSKTLVEMIEKSRYFYEELTGYDPIASQAHLTQEQLPALQEVTQRLKSLPSWEAHSIHEVIQTTTETLHTKMGNVAQPIRVAVTGNTMSPPIDITLVLLGRERTLQRLQKAINYIQQRS